MAWTTLPVYTNGTLTAAQLNAIKDNINETAPAKAFVGSWPLHFSSTATNTVAAREIKSATVDDSDTTGNTSWSNLAHSGPDVNITTGAFALVFPAARAANTLAAGLSYASFELWGTTTMDAEDEHAVAIQGTSDIRAASVQLVACTPGSGNHVNMVYRVSQGNGNFSARRLTVMAL